MEPMKAFDLLLQNFARDKSTAQSLKSPNQEDDILIRAGIVGYSYCSPTETWGINHFEFLKRKITTDLQPRSLEMYPEGTTNIRLFFCLCLGYLLGLFQAGMINERIFALGEAQLPGFVAINSSRIIEA